MRVGTSLPHPRLKPVNELDDVGVVQLLQHLEFVIDHLLIASDILLQDDLDGDFALGGVGFANDSISART